jgi:cell division protein FtsB
MRPSRKPRIILILLIGLCGIFVYSYTSRLGEQSHVQAEIVAMQARIDAAKAEQFELLGELDALSDADFLDRVAREKFGLAKPGDKLLVIIDEPSENANIGNGLVPATTTNPIDFRNFPVWQQWIVFFTTDSFTISLP